MRFGLRLEGFKSFSLSQGKALNERYDVKRLRLNIQTNAFAAPKLVNFAHLGKELPLCAKQRSFQRRRGLI
jgi:hypothetical protein